MPSASAGQTWSVCGPAARPVYDAGLAHGAAGAPSSEQVKVTRGDEAENVSCAVVSEVPFAGPEFTVAVGVSRPNHGDAWSERVLILLA